MDLKLSVSLRFENNQEFLINKHGKFFPNSEEVRGGILVLTSFPIRILASMILKITLILVTTVIAFNTVVYLPQAHVEGDLCFMYCPAENFLKCRKVIDYGSRQYKLECQSKEVAEKTDCVSRIMHTDAMIDDANQIE
ncbi:hypothetical protein AB6A40_008967 [Gnathostoma spinigerum]|uniref:Uncharacterized protein n=1 Tax=Gnathostoma spinigerum TaxID=75299 RepID=A0ABD6EYV3_9BILA